MAHHLPADVCLLSSQLWLMQQAPPVQLSREQRQLLGEFTGGFLTLVVEPRHCSSPEGVENMIWMLLTFYSYLDLQVKSFKVHSRAQLQSTAEDTVDCAELHCDQFTTFNLQRVFYLLENPIYIDLIWLKCWLILLPFNEMFLALGSRLLKVQDLVKSVALNTTDLEHLVSLRRSLEYTASGYLQI
jgi:hypothetical protein